MRARIRAALILSLLLLASTGLAQDVTVRLSPNSGPPGELVTVDLLTGPPFSPTAVYALSFGDDLASLYARTSAQFTWVSPSQLAFTVPAGADCGTHYFGIVAPAPGPVRYRVPKGRTPFEVTGSCNPDRRNSLDLLNYNIQLMPDIACSHTDLACDRTGCPYDNACSLIAHLVPACAPVCDCTQTCGKDIRVELLGENGELKPPDVIVFEEAFSDSHRQRLRDLLRPQYTHQSTVLGRDSGFDQDGGVTVFSKWPIEQVEGHIYEVCEGFWDDCRAAKGVQYVRINKGGQRHHIFATHTDSGEAPADAGARVHQIFEMRDFMQRMLSAFAAPDEPVIMSGDFNIDKHVAVSDYNFMLRQLNAFHPETIDRDNPGARIGTNKSGNWIDYVLYRYDYLQPTSAFNYVIKPKDSRSPYTDSDLSDHFAVLGRFYFHGSGSPPPPPPPDPNPLPSPNHPIDFGYYFVDGKYGDFRNEVNCYTNLYYALSVNNYFGGADWPRLLDESLRNATAEGRRIHLNLNWEASGADPGRVLDIAAPFWDKVARIEMEDEPGWSRAETENNIAQLRSMLQARGLAARPIGAVYTQNQLRFDTAIQSNGLDWVGVEAYVNPPGSPISQDNIDALDAFLDEAKGLVPANKDLVFVMMAYDRNGAWTNIDTLFDLQTIPYLHAFNDPRVVAITMFSYGRPGGTHDHPELKLAHQKIARAIFGTQSNECVVVDPPSTPPIPTGPSGCITELRPTFSWSAVPGATRYRVVVIHVARDWIAFNATTTGLSFTAPTDLLGGQEYRWKVKAVNSGGSGPWSDSIYFHTLCNFDGPYLLSAGPGCVNTLRPTFVWGAVPGARDYRIVVAPAGTDDFFISEFPSATSFTPSFDLQAGREYRWKVKGRNEVVDGTWSRHRFFTPMCSPNVGTPSPLNPWFGTTPSANPIFNWEVASNATAYDLVVTTQSGAVVFQGSYSAELICSKEECSVTPSLSLSNGAYFWWVTGHQGAQNGPGSPQIGFTVSAGLSPTTGTPIGLNVVSPSGSVTSMFELVGTPGTTTAIPIDPASAGPLPAGFTPFRNMAFDVSTTAAYFEQVTVTFQMPDLPFSTFANLRVFHREVDLLVDRTTSLDFATKTVSARVNSLSPFVIAQFSPNHAPIARCRNVEVAQDSSGVASVSASQVNAGSSDLDGDALSFALQPAGPFTLGSHSVTLIVTDSHGASSSCTATINVVDRTPPTTTAAVSPLPNAAGWQKSDVTISVSSTDNVGGSGVKEIRYRAEGAQSIATTTVSGATASVTISSSGVTTFFHWSVDVAGNIEQTKSLTIQLDQIAPAVSCAAADGLWHPSDVSLACTASDAHSGLADPANASFSLQTSVPAGSETADAMTSSRTVCDRAENCATAGPIGGNRIDKKPPTINLASPAESSYIINQTVLASYECVDGGSGVQSCVGGVPSGSRIDTGSVGTMTFTVNARDQVGNSASRSVSYIVTYRICLQFDETKEHKAGSAVPVRIQICDALGNNLSTPQIAVTAVSLMHLASNTTYPPEDEGNANGGGVFRFVGGNSDTQAGYLFNLRTRNLPVGEYRFAFRVSGDPLLHSVRIILR